MSPTKPASTHRRAPALGSSIPISSARRVKPISTRLRKMHEKSELSVFNDSTSTSTSPTRPLSYYSNKNKHDANKENIPVLRSRTIGGGSGSSPTRGKTGVSKPTKSPTKRISRPRAPLRELSEAEVFIRDDAVLADIRRRRSGGPTAVEVESHLAPPLITLMESSTRESSVTSLVTNTNSTGVTEPDVFPSDVDDNDGPFRVRADKEDELRLKLSSLVSATRTSTKIPKSAVPRFAVTSKATKLKHPAAKTIISTPASPASTSGSPIKKHSPVVSRRSMSPIAKLSPSPIKARVGLGAKSVNTIMKNAADGKKKVIVASSSSATAKKMTTRKTANASLRRLGGSKATAGVSSLADIKRLR